MSNNNAPRVSVGLPARDRPINLQTRTVVEYDPTYMEDRIRCDVLANGRPVGAHAVATIDAFRGLDWATEALKLLAPDLERRALEEFLGVAHRAKVQELVDEVERLATQCARLRGLESEVERLTAHIERPRWFRRVVVDGVSPYIQKTLHWLRRLCPRKSFRVMVDEVSWCVRKTRATVAAWIAPVEK